jgi:NAD-dependent dihydropyrimidine dehydrogenase PreA subunit
MKVCIGNVLHAAWLKPDWRACSPRNASTGSATASTTAPSAARSAPPGPSSALTLEEKHTAVIGRAYFDRNRCLPYAAGIPCIVCEEHCPTPDKAIKFREAEVINSSGELVSLLQPYVVEELCIGCGICENRCPINGQAAVLVTAEGESRHADEFIGFGGGY